MHKTLFAILLGALTAAAADDPGRAWETHSRAGWNETLLKAAREYMSGQKTAAAMIVQSGRVVDQWGDVSRKIQVRSVRKSFLNALYGIHVAEGHIDLSKSLAQLGIDDNAPSLTDVEKQATVLDLLRARSGVYHLVPRETPYMKGNRPQRGSQYPGAYHYYNNWDFNVLGTIFEQVTKKNIFEEFESRIARPIGMEDFVAADGFYESGPESLHRQYMFRMSARDMARFGVLFLRKGRWGERQVVPEEWVARSTTPYSPVPPGNTMPFVGYGLLWWVSDWGYAALGADGHIIAVIPAKDLVVVHRVMYDPPREDAVAYRVIDTMIRMVMAAAPAK
jgi:CubicO group peptidase (beta-lactamase class C family)